MKKFVEENLKKLWLKDRLGIHNSFMLQLGNKNPSMEFQIINYQCIQVKVIEKSKKVLSNEDRSHDQILEDWILQVISWLDLKN